MRDLASLNNMEMLPWDVWGAMMTPEEQPTAEHLTFFDHLAALTRQPEASPAELRRAYDDERVRVPASVFNAVLQRNEPV